MNIPSFTDLDLTLSIGEDIRLEPTIEEHAAATFAQIDANREYLKQWLPWVDMAISVESSQENARRCVQEMNQGKRLEYTIFYRGEQVGRIGTHTIDWLNRSASLGYWLAPQFQGKGIIHQSCQALINFLFNTLELHRLEIHAAVGNEKSQKVAEKLGFTREGVLREAENLYGTYVDQVLYSRLRNE